MSGNKRPNQVLFNQSMCVSNENILEKIGLIYKFYYILLYTTTVIHF